jgi:hypothetical protein
VFVPGHFVQQSLVLSLPTVLMGSPLVLPNFPSCSLSCWIEVSWLWCKLDHYLSFHQRCSRRLAAIVIVIVIVIHFTTILAGVRGNGYSGRGWKRLEEAGRGSPGEPSNKEESMVKDRVGVIVAVVPVIRLGLG